MSNSNKHRPKPMAPLYSDYTIGSLIDYGAPPLDTRSANLISSAQVKPIIPEAAKIEHQRHFPPSQLPIITATSVPDINKRLPSLLLTKAEKSVDGILGYDTEADVQVLVNDLLLDAITIFGNLRKSCKVRLDELSVFSLRPDIIVVHHAIHGIILVIMVRKPDDIPDGSNTNLSVFEAPKIAGQLYDYLMGMYHMGNATPFGILTTYDYMSIVWLDNPESNRIMKNQSSTLSSPYPVHGEQNENVNNKPDGASNSISPLSFSIEKALPSITPLYSAEEDDPQAEDPPTEDDLPRNINYSTKYNSAESFKAVLLAIRCGLEVAKKKSERDIPKHGDVVQGTCALCHSTGLSWKNIPNTTIDYINIPSRQTKSLYLWKDLGRGSSGRAFPAFNSSGMTCVVKFFHYQRSAFHNDNDPLVVQALKNRSKSQAETECALWHLMYPEYTRVVRILELNKTYGVVMPYFDSVTSSDEKRSFIPQIRQELNQFKEKGYKYDDDDIRWRHIGIRGQNLAFIDLRSLKRDKNVTDAHVDKQVKMIEDTV